MSQQGQITITQIEGGTLDGTCVLGDDTLTTSTGNTITFPSDGGTLVTTADLPQGVANPITATSTTTLSNKTLTDAKFTDNQFLTEDGDYTITIPAGADRTLASEYYVDSAVSTATTGMATQTWVNNQGFLKSHQSLSDYVTKTGTQTLTNKTLTSPTLNTPTINNPTIKNSSSKQLTLPAITANDEIVTKDYAQTLTNKTLTTPIIAKIRNSSLAEITIPTGNVARTLATVMGTETLSNKTLAQPILNMPVIRNSNSQTLTLPAITASDEIVTKDYTQTLSGKTLYRVKFTDNEFLVDANVFVHIPNYSCTLASHDDVAGIYSTGGSKNLYSFKLFTHEDSYKILDFANYTFTSLTTSLASRFSTFNNLRELRLDYSETFEKVTDASNMFKDCYNLEKLVLPSATFEKVTTLSSMFENCYSLTEVVMPNATFALATNITNLFKNCYSLQRLSLPSATFAALTASSQITGMWVGCKSLSCIRMYGNGIHKLGSYTGMWWANGSNYNTSTIWTIWGSVITYSSDSTTRFSISHHSNGG